MLELNLRNKEKLEFGNAFRLSTLLYVMLSRYVDSDQWLNVKKQAWNDWEWKKLKSNCSHSQFGNRNQTYLSWELASNVIGWHMKLYWVMI